MKKIGIITLNGYFNYGNRLQNYALQQTLESFNTEVETLRIERFAIRKSNIYYMLRNTYRFIKDTFSKNKIKLKREEKFLDFTVKYIHESRKTYFVNENNDYLKNKFDFFVIGSDQVWNPSMNAQSGMFFADFANQNQRITYAPSFGISELSNAVEEKYKKWIEGVDHLSVREDDGAKIIKNLTEKSAPVLVDPTLLLSAKEWGEIASVAPQTEEKYLLTYFLGGIPDQHRESIESYAASRKLKIINLNDLNNLEVYETGPSEFLYYIQNCDLFCTDSFHGCAFSIIFQRPFIAYDRVGKESMFSRIETLLEMFQFKDRKYSEILETEQAFEIDFKHTIEILEREQERAIEYLKAALSLS